jgi:nitroreductase
LHPENSLTQLYIKVKRMVYLSDRSDFKAGRNYCAAQAGGCGGAREIVGSTRSFSMIGDFEGASSRYGNRGYRYVHFEAGAIGQRMYLAAEALGLGATGIGAFFDEEVNRYLGLSSGASLDFHGQ